MIPPTFLCGVHLRRMHADPGIEIPRELHAPGVSIIDKHETFVRPSGKDLARMIRKAITPIIDEKWYYVSDKYRNHLIESAIARILKTYEIH